MGSAMAEIGHESHRCGYGGSVGTPCMRLGTITAHLLQQRTCISGVVAAFTHMLGMSSPLWEVGLPICIGNAFILICGRGVYETLEQFCIILFTL